MSHQSPIGLNEWPVLAVHLVVESAGVAQVMAVAIASPQWSGSGATVHAFATLCKRKNHDDVCQSMKGLGFLVANASSSNVCVRAS